MQSRKTSAMLLLAAVLVTSGCAAGPEARNKEVARRVVTEILSGGNFELANELYAPTSSTTVRPATSISRRTRRPRAAGRPRSRIS
jgi:cytochrome oxidase Cu insertion factor (SCO1/SenC/PrrC family)